MGFAIPALLFSVAFWASGQVPPQEDGQSSPATTQSHTAQTTPPNAAYFPIPVLNEGKIGQMDLEEYIVGVLLAEMPASFELDALKAQAVAARTFALKTHTDGNKHDSAAVCTSYACCQAYMSPEAYLARGWSESNVNKVRQAVAETAGEVLVYEGKLIMATYFACSGGSTENAVAVWGKEYPYLQAVQSPGEEETVYYSDQKTFTPEEFQTALGVKLEGTPQTWFGVAYYTSGGGVDTLEIGGVAYRGTTLRSLLELRSTAFTVIATEDAIIFETRGYGHRVGMSQYGADAMAMTGSSYRQILEHYYQGTGIVHYLQTKRK